MRIRRKNKFTEEQLAEAATAHRKSRESVAKHRFDLIEAALLGLDDGSEEAALSEELDFDKFLEVMDEEYEEGVERFKDSQRDRPVLEEQKKFRERHHGLKTWR